MLYIPGIYICICSPCRRDNEKNEAAAKHKRRVGVVGNRRQGSGMSVGAGCGLGSSTCNVLLILLPTNFIRLLGSIVHVVFCDFKSTTG